MLACCCGPLTWNPGCRLQQDANQNDTFSPRYISLSHANYEDMVRALRLPFRAIEGTSVVGPFFWSSFDQDDDDPHLRE